MPLLSPLRWLHPRFEDWKADLAKCLSPAEQRSFIQSSLQHKTMLHIFGRFFFPHIIKGDYDTPAAHLSLIEFLTSPETGAAIFPRGFAKSTWEKIDTIHDIVYGLEPVILFISSSIQDAQFHFESVKGELENNDWLREVYGNLVPRIGPGVKWTNTHFETTNGVNVIARGAGKGRGVNIRNKRPTKVIVDDSETDEMVHSESRRKKFWRWLMEVVLPMIDKERGRVKMIGTVIHPDAAVKRFHGMYGGIFRRAIEDSASIWPEMWSVEELHRLRDGWTDEAGIFHEGIGTRAFSQEYMNEPINDETSMFRQEWLDRSTWEHLPELRELDIVMVIDPNAGQSQMADFMGVVVLGQHKVTRKIYVLEAAQFKGPIGDALTFIDGKYTKWNPRIMGVEVVLNQTAHYQLLLATNKYRLRKVEPEGKDKVNRAKYVEPIVEQGVVRFHPSHVALYNELITFPNGKHDDLVDAFVYACLLLRGNTAKLKKDKSAMQTANLRKKKF